ncbi:hypothetical protein [Sediminibacterium goheungense]|uniref:Uncharacterized protein n=1 Tax=Sediminibacterium goheungense TaxID=1086393 RepID=A0A4R6IWN5_9BACT|nr:hypothetical protein [Sediminibacterium goheungense]TDO26315.1 hypothetical protein BC659_1621 [Sediminibacterium goheungense]
MRKEKKTISEQQNDFVIGLFGIKYPKNYRYRISSEWELAEVKWLISEGDFKSIEEYEISTTRLLLSQA